ncbi:MAG: tetratricopeptide repeat protein [Verrucomicrobia bacterium]|nr:tetratricopeptide repeat protein [Verrucomicrobiota bacterium]
MNIIVRVLQEAMGLDVASIGEAALERGIRRSMERAGETDPNRYIRRLRENQAELLALIDEVVVPETWFFRDRAAIDAVVARTLSSSHARSFRFLCVACASGEEPYSLAMALAESGLPRARVQLEALDISEPLLARARRGIYGANSFRGTDLAFRDTYFERLPEGQFQLVRDLRESVRFRRANLIDPGAIPTGSLYDAIFCRNVLIYLGAAQQRAVVSALAERLSPDGLLLVAPAESGTLLRLGLVSAQIPRACAFHPPRTVESPAIARLRASALAPVPEGPVMPARLPLPAATPRVPEITDAARLLLRARELADSGQLEAAAPLCERYLAEQGPAADAYFLLGLVEDARGHTDAAISYYRRALYIDPVHRETLIHYPLVAERAGDVLTASALRERARRLPPLS